MKNFMLVWAGLWRKPVRTILTTASVAVAFFLFGSLRGITQGLDAVVNGLNSHRLRVQSRASFRDPLPLSYFSQIERIEGVSNLGYVTLLDAYYRDPKNSITAVGQGGKVLESKPPEFKLSKEQATTFFRTPTGAIVGSTLAARYGWKIGDRVPLQSTTWIKEDGTSVWAFDIVGIWTVEGQPETAQEFYFHYDYLDQARTTNKSTVSLYFLTAADPSKVAAAIDQTFANSPNPTLTQSDRDWVRSQMKQAGDINLMVNAIVGASLFTLLFLTGNTMMQSVRERTPELAVLKTLGFSDIKVLSLVIAEATLLCLFGAVLGLLAADAVFRPLSAAMQAPLMMPLTVIAAGVIVAAGTAIGSAVLPCWRAARLSIVDALAGR
jgi:putative ABC transport system permease protein